MGKSEEDSKRKNGDACALCGSEKLLFEPPVFYCNGNNCPTKRINRNRYYFVGGNNQYHWCHPCYSDLNSTEKIQMVDLSMKKEQLIKRRMMKFMKKVGLLVIDVKDGYIKFVVYLIRGRIKIKDRNMFVQGVPLKIERKGE